MFEFVMAYHKKKRKIKFVDGFFLEGHVSYPKAQRIIPSVISPGVMANLRCWLLHGWLGKNIPVKVTTDIKQLYTR